MPREQNEITLQQIYETSKPPPPIVLTNVKHYETLHNLLKTNDIKFKSTILPREGININAV